ncbi:hypothetical protein ACH79_17025 [Bradyrhizobium sp. CCBAU 051011]|uniref:hypothetical protein n=1 Tax=Bradyrhizobium sp. CCBAU 051011 TaxID=858422 RepID=UPI0013742285|nr:hypothetical protein [Bradyrhizobium sp. CCBAU 051011]QHO74081.1 hypothetical protein ACH79_17025 [Bradyrhizobium sp. CCBAU 051011]
MSELRDLVLNAHGVARWKSASTIEGYMSITGMLWARKGWPDALKQVHVTTDTGAQRVSYQPFTKPDWRSVYHPEAVAIETSNGKPIKSRANGRDRYCRHPALIKKYGRQRAVIRSNACPNPTIVMW